jgi:hypothetical protein
MLNTTKSNKLENNPFFNIDVNRFGGRFAMREWLSRCELLGRDYMTQPLDTCATCAGEMWASPTRPVICYNCYKNN